MSMVLPVLAVGMKAGTSLLETLLYLRESTQISGVQGSNLSLRGVLGLRAGPGAALEGPQWTSG